MAFRLQPLYQSTKECAPVQKKIIIPLCILLTLTAILCIYFKPLSFSIEANDSLDLSMFLNEYTIQNGEPDIRTTEFQHLTTGQKSAVNAVLKKYPYKRTIATLFSDGSISGTGKKLLTIYVFSEPPADTPLIIASSGKVIVRNKTYALKNAENLIAEIEQIMAQAQ